jgi:choline-phosphate cytidylyltransferase
MSSRNKKKTNEPTTPSKETPTFEEEPIRVEQTQSKLDSAPVFLPDGTPSDKKRKLMEAFEEKKKTLKEKKLDYKVNPVPKDRPVRVYADGIFDLFHLGHARGLQQAKNIFPNTYLIVGVCGDEITHKIKGKTVMNEDERVECVAHCRYVDEVITDAPWTLTQEFLDKHQIDFVTHGEDDSYDEEGNDVYKWVKDQGKFLVVKRTEGNFFICFIFSGISTSDLILRIVRDYDTYIRRNLSRGYSTEDMNIPFLKSTSIYFNSQVEKLGDTVRHGVENIGENISDRTETFMETVKKWKDFSEGLVFDFFMKFSGQWDNLLTGGTMNENSMMDPPPKENSISTPTEEEEELKDGEEPDKKKRKRE